MFFYYSPSFSPQLGSELIGNVDYDSLGYVPPEVTSKVTRWSMHFSLQDNRIMSFLRMWTLVSGIHVFRTQLYHLLTVWIWESSLPSLRLCYLIHKVGRTTNPPHSFVVSVGVGRTCNPPLLGGPEMEEASILLLGSDSGETLQGPLVIPVTGHFTQQEKQCLIEANIMWHWIVDI